jgi:hypothetical protein
MHNTQDVNFAYLFLSIVEILKKNKNLKLLNLILYIYIYNKSIFNKEVMNINHRYG